MSTIVTWTLQAGLMSRITPTIFISTPRLLFTPNATIFLRGSSFVHACSFSTPYNVMFLKPIFSATGKISNGRVQLPQGNLLHLSVANDLINDILESLPEIEHKLIVNLTNKMRFFDAGFAN